jgi:hypothetical protein
MRTETTGLRLYEEIMLLALRDDKGTLLTYVAEFAIAGALLAELMLDGRIAITDAKKQHVGTRDTSPTGDPILDEALARIAKRKRPASVVAWLGQLAGAKWLRHRAAQQLCRRGILRADEKTVLLFFKQKLYPELDPMPERRLLERMRAAVTSESGTVDPRTAAVISLAHGTHLLSAALGKDVVKRRRHRIEAIVRGEATGKAAKAAIEAHQAAMIVMTVVPGVIAATSRR